MGVSGPFNDFAYTGHGNFYRMGKSINSLSPFPKKRIGLIANGIGILSTISIAQASIYSKDDIEITVLYAN